MNDALVAVGIGNTTITFGVCAFPAETCPGSLTKTGASWRWSQQVTVNTHDFDPARLALDVPPDAVWRVASVHRPSEERLATWVRGAYTNASYCNLLSGDLPINVRVDHPERVGMDRLAAAVAVNRLRDPDKPALIVDAGTAITVDLVNEDGDFLGGAILPGMRLVAHALATKTDLLPQVDPDFVDAVPDALGTSTAAAIRSGLFWGSVGAIRELVHRIGEPTTVVPQLFLTGGDAERLAPFINRDAHFVKDLVLGGILASVRN